MSCNVAENVELVQLARLAAPALQQAEQRRPPQRGAKPAIPDWALALMIFLAVLKKNKSKSAQWRFLRQDRTRQVLREVVGDDTVPPRSTFMRRYRQVHSLLQGAIEVQGRMALAEWVCDATDVAVDKSMLEAPGGPWHKRDQKKGKVPAGTDTEAGWGYSEYSGWVYGYSFEVVVCSTPGSVPFPLVASASTASAAECRTFADKIDCLPAETRTVSADSGYDSNALGERIEYDETDEPTGRHYLCPENPRNERPQTKPSHATKAQRKSRERRRQRKEYFESEAGRKVYRRRSKTVEPFNSWLKSLFELDQRAWHRGLDNNRTQLLTALFAYQALVRFNHQAGRTDARVQWILEAL